MPIRNSARPGGRRSSSPNSWEMERRYSVPTQEQSVVGSESRLGRPGSRNHGGGTLPPPNSLSAAMVMGQSASEDLHAWSIYRQNLNSDFTDSALGSSEKSPLPYGNFQLRESTVQSILSHPRYGPKSPLGSNMYTYLKFGLPRVFPPNGRRDGSSGYDSSEDGTARNQPQDRRNYMRTRSDPDFRNAGPYYGPSVHSVAETNLRSKSMSEANLLSGEAVMKHTRMPPKSYRRSMHDLRLTSELGPHPPMNAPHYARGASHLSNGRPASMAVGPRVANSMLDLNRGHRGTHSIVDGAPSIISASRMSQLEHMRHFQAIRGDLYNGLYPHLQLRSLSVEEHRKGAAYIQSISLEVKAGELLAILSTTVKEGKCLLDAIAGQRKATAQHVILNGQTVTLATLKKRLVYARFDATLSPELDVAQTLTFYSHLRQPPKTSAIFSSQISLLIDELGLSQVLHTNVSSLTQSEVQRLKIACYLLSDPEILLLDRPTNCMDIFDTFFLVEFLRQWANGGSTGKYGKIVILTLQPPTYEIFTMVSRVALVSNGKTMFYGKRRDMLPYFASVDYPCPAYKNPSDYYLDLVTLDELSSEAMLESSQRVEQLADIFRHRQEPLSDPGPPQSMPGKPRGASFFFQIIAIMLRQMIYSQPNSFLRWISHLLTAAFLSVFIGAIFWNIPQTDPQLVLNDRMGFHYTVMHVGAFPLLLLRSLSHAHGRERLSIESDISDQLYGRTAYIVVSLLCQLPASLLVWMVYITPCYAMSSLYQQGDDPDAFHVYISYMLLHMCTLQSLLTFIGYATPNRCLSTSLSCAALLVLNITSGFPLHLKDMEMNVKEWIGVVSPTRWILPWLLRREYSTETLAGHTANIFCRNKQVQHQDIIVQLPCPTPNGTAALHYFNQLAHEALPAHFRQRGSLWNCSSLWLITALSTVLAFVILGRLCVSKKKRL